MTKTLNVIKPFFVMEPGDTFELSQNGNYVSSYSSEYVGSDENDEISSSYSSNYEISPAYAKSLIEDGYLEENNETTLASKNYVNVFDEIEKLTKMYSDELNNLASDYMEAPACLKVEKETVLTNMLKVLEHLHSLKK